MGKRVVEFHATLLAPHIIQQSGNSSHLVVQEFLWILISSLILPLFPNFSGRGWKFQPSDHLVFLLTGLIQRLCRGPTLKHLISINSHFLPLSMLIAVDFSEIFFIKLSKSTKSLLCWIFIMNGHCFYQMLFLYLLIWSCDFSSLAYCCVEFYDFHMLNQIGIAGINPTWSLCVIVFITLLGSISYLLCSWEKLICNSFLVRSLSGVGIRVMPAKQNELGSGSSASVFWKSWVDPV